MRDARIAEATELMTRFAERTGLTLDVPGRRYLWTDAFAVCNFLGLARTTGEGTFHELGLRLVDRVHEELGRHRDDDRRAGWISGLPEPVARAHPTRGGLRIGKPLPERASTEPFDPELEWDRDGQYFHYLTKWMHALDQVARFTGEVQFNVWARELADTAHRAFVHGPPGQRRMAWKASIDLSRPLVPSMGHHDPLDGFVTCKELGATAAILGSQVGPSLTSAKSDFGAMIDDQALATSDPLGIGGLLVDLYRLVKLREGRVAPAQRESESESELIASLLAAATTGLSAYLSQPTLRAPAHHRLAFREFGLALGLAAVSSIEPGTVDACLDATGHRRIAALLQCSPLRHEIESFWLCHNHRRTPTWAEHEDINDVMLATSLLPEGFLALEGPKRTSSIEAAGPSPRP